MNDRHGRLIDPEHHIHLDDHDDTRCLTAAEVIDHDGQRSYWIVDPNQLGDPDTDHGDEAPRHELCGPLPTDVADLIRTTPIRCNAATRSGRPCQRRIAVAGHRCPQHAHRKETHR